ncbi:type II toxin-antitoxin system RelE/ParE family toxin [Sphingomonas naphthae]|uniref:type II toxin-antitoxin system RelE/ParE family toxin n=1 Tax=Sphingomonas naphthae TaxID=1813468 RepID=UPI003B59E1D2
MTDDYWAQYSEESADAMLLRIHSAAAFLTGMPHAGQRLEDTAARKWTVRGTNYVLLYRVIGERLDILRVHHAAEDWRTFPE